MVSRDAVALAFVPIRDSPADIVMDGYIEEVEVRPWVRYWVAGIDMGFLMVSIRSSYCLTKLDGWSAKPFYTKVKSTTFDRRIPGI